MKQSKTAQATYERLIYNRVKYEKRIGELDLKIQRNRRAIAKYESKISSLKAKGMKPHWTDVIEALGKELSQLTGLGYKTLGTFGLRSEYCLWLYKAPLYSQVKGEDGIEREHLNTENIVYSLTFTPGRYDKGSFDIHYDTGHLKTHCSIRDDNGLNCETERLPMPIKAEQVLEIAKRVNATNKAKGVK